ncbi:hypothetical protein FW320_18820 [Azospirillum sp. Vi22]|nr:hypothetical protein [Azospirillum baldaniorum]
MSGCGCPHPNPPPLRRGGDFFFLPCEAGEGRGGGKECPQAAPSAPRTNWSNIGWITVSPMSRVMKTILER